MQFANEGRRCPRMALAVWFMFLITHGYFIDRGCCAYAGASQQLQGAAVFRLSRQLLQHADSSVVSSDAPAVPDVAGLTAADAPQPVPDPGGTTAASTPSLSDTSSGGHVAEAVDPALPSPASEPYSSDSDVPAEPVPSPSVETATVQDAAAATLPVAAAVQSSPEPAAAASNTLLPASPETAVTSADVAAHQAVPADSAASLANPDISNIAYSAEPSIDISPTPQQQQQQQQALQLDPASASPVPDTAAAAADVSPVSDQAIATPLPSADLPSSVTEATVQPSPYPSPVWYSPSPLLMPSPIPDSIAGSSSSSSEASPAPSPPVASSPSPLPPSAPVMLWSTDADWELPEPTSTSDFQPPISSQAVISAASLGRGVNRLATRRVLPIKEVTCYYDPKRGLLTGLKYTRLTANGAISTTSVGKVGSRLFSVVSLPDFDHSSGERRPVYITAVNVTYTSKAVVAMRFIFNNGNSQKCDVTHAIYDAPTRTPVARKPVKASAAVTTEAAVQPVVAAAKQVAAVQRRMAAALKVGVYRGGYPRYISGKDHAGSEALFSDYIYGPTLYGQPAGLAGFRAKMDPRNRYIQWIGASAAASSSRSSNSDGGVQAATHHYYKRPSYKYGGNWCYWVPPPPCPDQGPYNPPPIEPPNLQCSWWPCKHCHGKWVSKNCCCSSVDGGGGGGGGGNPPSPPSPPVPPLPPRRSPRPPRRSPRPPSPGRSPPPGPPRSPRPPSSPGPPGRSPRPPRSPNPNSSPTLPASPRPPGKSPGPIPPGSPRPNRSPSPKPRSPSPKPRSPSPRPRSPRPDPQLSPDPYDYSPEPGESPEPDLPSNFTIAFAARGQHDCVLPISPIFRANVAMYANIKLGGAGFQTDYSVNMGECMCTVDANQMNTPMYSCELSVSIKNPDVGSPYIISEYIAQDIDATGPWACIDEYQPWCQAAEEFATSSCAIFPNNPGHKCEIEPPPDPLPMPIVFVDEGRRCNASRQLSIDEQKSLRDYVFKFTTGLGLVLTYENMTCQEGGGNAWYQATLILAAGVDIDIYTGSDNIVTGMNQKPTLCQTASKPLFCNSAPMSRSTICAVNQYDPYSVYRCPLAGASAAVSVAVPSCSCSSSPDSATYQKSLAVWINDMMVQNGFAIGISVPEGRCVQMNQTVCSYQYRVRALPLDEYSDPFAAIQTIQTDTSNTPQPCWPVEASQGWPFCSYWQKATACAMAPWDPEKQLQCELLPTDGGSGGGGGDNGDY